MKQCYYFLIKKNEKCSVSKKRRKNDNKMTVIAKHENPAILKNIADNFNNGIPYVSIKRLTRATATYCSKQFPVITKEEKMPDKFRIRVIKKKLFTKQEEKKLHDNLKNDLANESYMSQDNSKNDNSKIKTEIKIQDKSEECLDIIVQNDKNRSNGYETPKEDQSSFLLDAFNRAFYKNLSNDNKNIIHGKEKNEFKIITQEPEICRNKSDEVNLTIIDEQSILQQIESGYYNEEIQKSLLNYPDINNISFIINEAVPLNSTYTIENFPEVENLVEKSDSICAAKKRKTTTKNKNKLCNKDKVKTKYKRTRWTDEEKNIVLNKFSTYLNTYKCPSNKEITALIGDNSCLQTRTVRQVKTWLNNQQKILRNNI